MRDHKVTDRFKGHFVHALLLREQNYFSFIPNSIIIPRKCVSEAERLMTFSGPTYPLFSFAMLFDSLRRDWNEGQWNDRGKSPHIQSSDGRGTSAPSASPARHVFLTSGFKAAIYLCPRPQPAGESRRKERTSSRLD